MHEEFQLPSSGVLRCLQAMAEEVEALGLAQTHLALQQAVSFCHAELMMRHQGTQEFSTQLVH